MTPPTDVPNLIKSLPLGTSKGTATGKRYVATRSAYSDGRSTKLVAEELGGKDYISLNLYELSDGPQLYPCEMSPDKVIAFVRAYTPDPQDTK